MDFCFAPLQDITSLLHTIYEVVDSSVNHSPTSSKTLRVKLTVAPDGSQGKKGILLNHPGEGLEGCPGHRGQSTPRSQEGSPPYLGGVERSPFYWEGLCGQVEFEQILEKAGFG